ncbi:mas-related G-protein coupled receptor member D [Dipodomys spectabilis]|uniref:mas-related G-protein coupled receptor member D n=1 Tax=Dipodomys spectabilis TaxID=105255 RepID=UPI001C53F7C0|nr:mas-related G-protein coupled receptor member D [Dipodomys spectabilis]
MQIRVPATLVAVAGLEQTGDKGGASRALGEQAEDHGELATLDEIPGDASHPFWMSGAVSSTPAPRPAGEPPGPDGVTVGYLALSSLTMAVCVCGMAGNSLVVWLLGFRIRRTPFCVYVLNLAAADLLFLLCMAALLVLETQPLGSLGRAEPVHQAYEVLKRTKYLAYTAGLSLLTAISTQRCLSVLFPVWYKCRRPQHLSARVCAGLWLLALLTNALTSFFCSWFWDPDAQHCFTVDMVMSGLILGCFTPLMIVSSTVLFVRVRWSPAPRRRQPLRLYLVILASVLVFLACSLPLGLYWFFLYWLRLPEQPTLLLVCLSRLSSALGSSANPLIYFVVGSRQHRGPRESLGAVLARALREEPMPDDTDPPSTATSDSL